MMIQSNKLGRFAKGEAGALSIEAILILPLLIWAVLAVVVFWDGFRTSNVNQKATYTVADMLSREIDPIDGDYLTALHELHDFLNGNEWDNTIRVTVVVMREDPETEERWMEIAWSEGVGIERHENITAIEDRVPTMAPGEQLILVESELDWEPFMKVGVPSMGFDNLAVARPRFAPQLIWDDAA